MNKTASLSSEDCLMPALRYLFPPKRLESDEGVHVTIDTQRQLIEASGRLLLSDLFNAKRATEGLQAVGPETARELDTMQYIGMGRFDLDDPFVREELGHLITTTFLAASVGHDDHEIAMLIGHEAKNQMDAIQADQIERKKRKNRQPSPLTAHDCP